MQWATSALVCRIYEGQAMSRKFLQFGVLVAVVLVAAGNASAASPDVAAMNLQAADVPGAKVASQHSVNEKGYLSAYARNFLFSVPDGSAQLISIQSETLLAASAATARADVASAEKAYRSTSGRKALIASFAKQLKVKTKAVVIGKLRTVAGYDQGFEMPISVSVKGRRVYESLIILRLDRVAVGLIELGLRPVGVGVTAKYAAALAGHIGTELSPMTVTPPAISGTPQQGQTLTATSGSWTAPDATFAYQWQRCDSAGANCVDVPGATASAYAVTAADAGMTLHVVVTATNRFGSAPATSGLTAVVT
jgi:hypothetical protein